MKIYKKIDKFDLFFCFLEGDYMKIVNKKRFGIVIGIAILVIVAVIAITMALLNSNKEVTNTQFSEDEKVATNDIVVEDITFSNIHKQYANGVTTIKATVSNNTKKTKTITIKILLKDDAGNVINEMMQVIEDIEPRIEKVLTTAVTGNYSYVSNIEFQVVE